ncbi:hypothetical protein CCACVL1_26937 [Corchorus capsularis]|uniref:(+)-delta-cadinene synthase n=1 Tax=Corchorus capsularis TaxID=210143 RepID=A0A1R3GCU4_COCAP|nr:hypothetical protein CCACVL1_26937 [Corchorus capsularis]
MAHSSMLTASVPKWDFIKVHGKGISNRTILNRRFHVVQVQAQTTKLVATANVSDQKIVRRYANYHPPIWEYDYIQSIKSDYLGKSCNEQAMKLVGEVRTMLDKVMDPLEMLELVDSLQRLGLAYHFENETKRILESIVKVNQSNVGWKKNNLHATALEFRLLRQHGYKVAQEVFSSFMDETGDFRAGLNEDCKGLLNLYEASFFSVEGENILEKARDFATKHLKEYVKQKNKDEYLSMLVEHALDNPLHWRVLRLEARWFIDVYERQENRIPILLELAKLDFNIVQAVHQDDLRDTSKWWKDTGLGQKLSFARDRLMENFLWTVGVVFDPKLGNVRRNSTKVNALITTIDDVYDVYGTLDELELFTQAVERWEINSMDPLPEYMKICFLALFNSVNIMAYDTLKEKGFDSLHFLKKAWANLCKSYLLEAKWYYSGYTPTLQEYLDNAWISISAPLILTHAYLATNSTRKECLECFDEYSNIIYCSSMILRLADDLGTSSDEIKRGDVPKSIQCYMHETGSSEEEARKHIRKLIDATWKKMNEDRIAHPPSSHTFVQIALNLARMAQCMYQHGDGHGIEDHETKDRVLSLLIFPIR